jgi:hypothetical protein
MLQTEALQQKTEEAQQMREKVMALELTVSSGAEEKGQYEVTGLLIMPGLTQKIVGLFCLLSFPFSPYNRTCTFHYIVSQHLPDYTYK